MNATWNHGRIRVSLFRLVLLISGIAWMFSPTKGNSSSRDSLRQPKPLAFGWEISADSCIHFIAFSANDFLGIASHENQLLSSFVHPDEKAKLKQLLEQTLNEESTCQAIIRLKRFDNTYHCFQLIANARSAPNKTNTSSSVNTFTPPSQRYIFGTAELLEHSISKSKNQNSDTLDASQNIDGFELLRSTIQHSPVMLSFLGPDFKYRLVSQHYPTFFGLTESEIIGKTPWELLGEAAQVIAPKQLEAFEDSPTHYVINLPRNGEEMSYQNAHLPVRDRNDNVVGVLNFAQEQTVPLRNERWLRLILDNAPNSAVYVDRETKIQFVNARFESFWQLDAANVTGRRLNECLPNWEQDDHHVNQVLVGRTVQFETTLSINDETSRRVDIRYLPDIDINGSVRGYYFFATDVTNSRQTERHL